MDETGVDFAMDVHGDEAIPANFLAGFEGIPSWTDALGEKFYDFGDTLARAHARFPDRARAMRNRPPGKANLTMSTNQLAERFGAVAMTLEMPFKDHDPNPRPRIRLVARALQDAWPRLPRHARKQSTAEPTDCRGSHR